MTKVRGIPPKRVEEFNYPIPSDLKNGDILTTAEGDDWEVGVHHWDSRSPLSMNACYPYSDESRSRSLYATKVGSGRDGDKCVDLADGRMSNGDTVVRWRRV